VFIISIEGFEEGDPGDRNALTLEEVLKEKNKHKWTAEDVESIRETLEGAEPVFSRVLARGRLLKNLDVYYAPNCVMNYDIASLDLPPPSVNLPSLTQANPLKSPPLTTTQLPAQLPVSRPVDIAKQISEIARIVTEEQKYNV
jgi:hypothetical protein